MNIAEENVSNFDSQKMNSFFSKHEKMNSRIPNQILTVAEKEFLEEIIDFITDGETSKFRKDDKLRYYRVVGELLSLDDGTVMNQLYGPKPPSMSENTFEVLDDKFKDKIKTFKNLSDIQRKNSEYIKAVFLVWSTKLAIRFENTRLGISEISSLKGKRLPKEKPYSENNKSKTNDFIESFADSSWYLYEQFEKHVRRRILRFKNQKEEGRYEVSLNAYNDGIDAWTGEAHFREEDQIIIATLKSSKGKHYTHILLETESRAPAFSLGVGHMTFNSAKNNNIYTKFIVLEKCKVVETLRDKSLLFEDKFPASVMEVFRRLKSSQLLFSHDLTIHDIESLEDILDRAKL